MAVSLLFSKQGPMGPKLQAFNLGAEWKAAEVGCVWRGEKEGGGVEPISAPPRHATWL